jgi:hypothetical protein
MDFDRKNLSILRFIKRKGKRGATWGELIHRFGDATGPFSLEQMSRELYTVTKNQNGEWVVFDDKWDGRSDYLFCSYITPKGNKLIEKRSFDFWKWVIPTLISVAALIVSIIAVLN